MGPDEEIKAAAAAAAAAAALFILMIAAGLIRNYISKESRRIIFH